VQVHLTHPSMKEILNTPAAEAKLHRMAIELAERNQHSDSLVLIGIRENGILIANHIAELLPAYFSGPVQVLSLSINKRDPGEVSLDKDISIEGRSVILIDDVANSGRTMLYALPAIINRKPRQVETLALIERSHKKFPVAVNYVGLSIATTSEEHIEVEMKDGRIVGAWLK